MQRQLPSTAIHRYTIVAHFFRSIQHSSSSIFFCLFFFRSHNQPETYKKRVKSKLVSKNLSKKKIPIKKIIKFVNFKSYSIFFLLLFWDFLKEITMKNEALAMITKKKKKCQQIQTKEKSQIKSKFRSEDICEVAEWINLLVRCCCTKLWSF